MAGKLLLIRADSGCVMGSGHVMRCWALAQAWRERGGAVLFYAKGTSAEFRRRLAADGIQSLEWAGESGSSEDASQTVALAQKNGAAWVVVDGYQFGSDYQRALKNAVVKVLVLDDYGHADAYCADFVLNQNVYAHAGLYPQRESQVQLLLGTQYALLRREFLAWGRPKREIPSTASKMLVTLGGSDAENVTLKVLHALEALSQAGWEAKVIVGGGNPHREDLQARVRTSQRKIELLCDVSNMPELMAWADLAVTAAGSTCWEMCFMGVPMVGIVLAENQTPIAAELEKRGVMRNLKWHRDVIPQQIADAISTLAQSSAARSEMVAAGQTLVDGQGGRRVVERLECA